MFQVIARYPGPADGHLLSIAAAVALASGDVIEVRPIILQDGNR